LREDLLREVLFRRAKKFPVGDTMALSGGGDDLSVPMTPLSPGSAAVGGTSLNSTVMGLSMLGLSSSDPGACVGWAFQPCCETVKLRRRSQALDTSVVASLVVSVEVEAQMGKARRMEREQSRLRCRNTMMGLVWGWRPRLMTIVVRLWLHPPPWKVKRWEHHCL
jgi:hypothetical protein